MPLPSLNEGAQEDPGVSPPLEKGAGGILFHTSYGAARHN